MQRMKEHNEAADELAAVVRAEELTSGIREKS
jgi:hypothetical protein